MSVLYEDVFRLFAERQVRYVVVGGIAVNAYNISRNTFDLDIVAEMSAPNLRIIVDTLTELGVSV